MLRPHLQAGQGDRMFFGEAAVASLDEFDQAVNELIQLTSRRAEYVSQILESGIK